MCLMYEYWQVEDAVVLALAQHRRPNLIRQSSSGMTIVIGKVLLVVSGTLLNLIVVI